MITADDLRHIRHARVLALRGMGSVAPNPSVGCVLISPEGRVVGRGTTGQGGRPHAETRALMQAGGKSRGSTAYVTLEPCSHHGQTPPCADALIAAGVVRVVARAEDPDPRVSGRGFARLRQAGIAVDRAPALTTADEGSEGFFTRIREGRPHVTLKFAQSLDGRIASASGESRWITGPQSRARGHLLRARSDAILIGIETALADDPLLTCRLPGLESRPPLRVVLDSRLRLPVTGKLASTAKSVPTLVYTTAQATDSLVDTSVLIASLDPDAQGRPRIAEVLRDLAIRGVTRVLVEGGAGVHAALLAAGMVDSVVCFRAPIVLGAGGHPTIAALALGTLAGAPQFRLVSQETCGRDVLESYVRER